MAARSSSDLKNVRRNKIYAASHVVSAGAVRNRFRMKIDEF